MFDSSDIFRSGHGPAAFFAIGVPSLFACPYYSFVVASGALWDNMPPLH